MMDPKEGQAVLPNLVLFVTDEWRGDVLGHVGNPGAKTPVLDRMVEEDGVSFSSAYCQNPVCTPSRCAFMSGWYPHVRGHRTLYHMLQADEPNLLEVLKSAGYQVWWGGKNDLVPADQDASQVVDVRYRAENDPEIHLSAGPREDLWRGSDASDPRYYGFYQGRLGEPGVPFFDRDRATIAAAQQWIRGVPRDQPFVLYLSLIHPHPPYGVEAPWVFWLSSFSNGLTNYPVSNSPCEGGFLVPLGEHAKKYTIEGQKVGTLPSIADQKVIVWLLYISLNP